VDHGERELIPSAEQPADPLIIEHSDVCGSRCRMAADNFRGSYAGESKAQGVGDPFCITGTDADLLLSSGRFPK